MSLSPRSDPRVGTSLGKYRFIGVLGSGGMGVVYEAEDTTLKRRVAIKLLPEATAADAETLRRFLHEARAAARLNHPHAVTVYEIGESGGVHYLAMELVRGGSMQERLDAEGRLAWQEATRVAADACRGLAAAHAAGLVHRDIKPSNTMRSADGTVKLADFGVAQATGPALTTLTVAGGAAGTPHYMSPEQCRNEQIDARSDIYSLGATYYALLVGKPPYFGGAPLQVMFAHCSQPAPDPRDDFPDIPEACAAVVRRAMAKYPAERYASAEEMLAALEGILSGAAPQREERGIRTRKPVSLAVAGLAVVVLLAAGFLLHSRIAGRAKPEVSSPPGRLAPASPADFSWHIPAEGLTLSMGGRVEAVAFSPDGKWLAAGCLDGEGGVRLWDLATGQQRIELWPERRFRTVVFSPDSRTLAAGGMPFRGLAVRLYDVGGSGERSLAAEAVVRGLAFDPRGHLLAAGLGQRPPGKPVYVKLWEAATGRELLNLGEHSDWVWAVLFSPDGKTLLSAGNDQQVRIWDTATGALKSKLATEVNIFGMALSPDGDTLAVAGFNELQFWDWKSGTKRDTRRQGGSMYCVAYSPDGRLLATGNHSGVATLWNAATHEESQDLRGHTEAIFGLAFSPDGRLLATAAWDHTVRLWNVGR